MNGRVNSRVRVRRRANGPGQEGTWVISNDARRALERCELFKDLELGQLKEVAALVEEYSLSPGEFLLKEGDPARYIFVVVAGTAIAQLEIEGGWLSLGMVGPYEAAGWSSLVDGQYYPASVKALTPMWVARMEARGLCLLMDLEPRIGYPIHRRLSAVFHRQYQTALKALKTTGGV